MKYLLLIFFVSSCTPTFLAKKGFYWSDHIDDLSGQVPLPPQHNITVAEARKCLASHLPLYAPEILTTSLDISYLRQPNFTIKKHFQVSGVTYPPRYIMVAWPTYKRLSETALVHEMLHAFLFKMVGDGDRYHTNDLWWKTIVPTCKDVLERKGL